MPYPKYLILSINVLPMPIPDFAGSKDVPEPICVTVSFSAISFTCDCATCSSVLFQDSGPAGGAHTAPFALIWLI